MSTLRLVQTLADRGWDIDFVVTTGGGALEGRLDPRVRLIALRSASAGERFQAARGLAGKLAALPDAAAYAAQRMREAWLARSFAKRRYDAAFVGLQGLRADFVCDSVRADRRFLWIRLDVGAETDREKCARNVRRYDGCIDRYICVSEYARLALERTYPATLGKAVTIYNVLDPDGMRRQAEGAGDPFAGHAGLKVLTVCRLQEKQKGLMRMAEVCRRLLDEGLDFHWLVAGDGPDRAMLEAKIRDLGLSGRMVLLGQQPNPFPLYAHADVVAVLSFYEGLCGTVNEAKVMGRAIVATTFSGVTEQIEDGVGGLIVDNDEDAIVEGMRRVLTDASLRERLAAGPLNPAILDDGAKLDALEALMGAAS